jgi:hypothetical protein
MFARRGNGALIAWSVVEVATGLVRDSGHSSTLADAVIQAGDGQDVLLGQALAPGSRILDDGSVEAPAPPQPPSVHQVRAECAKRLSYTDWYVTRASDPSDGREMPDKVRAERAAIKAACDRLLSSTPIPVDYRDPKYWA